MEGLVPTTVTATASTFQLILEHLCAVLLLISEGLRHVPGLPVFPWVILVGALVVVSLIVRRRHTSGSVKALGERYPAHSEVCAGCSENIGPMTDHLRRMLSPQDLVDLAKTVCKSQPPKCSQATDEKPISKALGTDGEQLQKNKPDDLNKHTSYPKTSELCLDETMGWKQNTQEKKEEKQRLEHSMARVQWVPQGRVSQSVSMVGHGKPLQTSPKPDVLRGHLVHVKSQVKRQRGAENEDQLVHGSEGDLKGVPRDADLNVSLQSADKGNQETARKLQEQRQINEELTAEMKSLRSEKASLQCENSNLKAEIQQLKLKLLKRSLEMEKKSLEDWRTMNSTYQILNTYRKMARDMNQELRRSTSYYVKEIRCHRERAEEAQMAAECTERKLKAPRRENDHDRQMPAKDKSTSQPFPGGPFAPAAPPTAHRGPEVSGHPLGHQLPRKEQDHAVRAQESRHTCRFDSAFTATGP
ncbi:hypothetical protein HJG60_008265 [Phyllostomus discolor]|uniref:Uncharacterized protein n=1 Tax=Phyllostomus discolor TaxID=89673 RepID=A0A833Z6S0_9CHIR|nr:hypothetical protein HJG60_008264 [Phyllostomus discolor]KAF6088440.1 hypothetical protein HJG60_008265 [Phyllostomus discolor]